MIEGVAVEGLILRMVDDSRVAGVHAHFAKRGCYAGLITRA